MLNILILILLSTGSLLCLEKAFRNIFVAAKNRYEDLYSQCALLIEENAKQREKNIALEKEVSQISALYDITKQMCKTLETGKVFESFKKQIVRFVSVEDCNFVKQGEGLSAYSDWIKFPLKIEKDSIGVLVVNRISDSDKEKFYILVQQFLLGMKRALLYDKIQELAITDTLTSVTSRRYCLERLAEEIERSKKMNTVFSILMIDVDNFKDFNDRYGHLVGDTILREAATVIKGNIRQIDLIGRYGGEEFLIILSETDLGHAKMAAERIRRAIEGNLVRAYDENLQVTISLGISSFPEHAKDMIALIDKADQALYKAKESGKNRVCSGI